jgi:hypothetical protein
MASSYLLARLRQIITHVSCFNETSLQHTTLLYLYLPANHYATTRQVAGSIPDGVIGIFQWHNPAGRTVATSYRNEYYVYFLGVNTAGA